MGMIEPIRQQSILNLLLRMGLFLLVLGLGTGIALVGDETDGGHRWTKLADLDHPVSCLILHQGRIYAATARRMERYGEPLPSEPLHSRLDLRGLARPTGTQGLILALTTALSGLVLMARTAWLGGDRQAR